MPEPADPNVYLDEQITNLCNCPVKDDGGISAEEKRKMKVHAKRCWFRRRAVQWLGWPTVDVIALADPA